MRHVPAATTVMLGILLAGSARAEPRCDVPLIDWQPREALARKVEAEGWRVTRIRTDDGCYEVRATNDRGERFEGKYDPGTLQLIHRKIER